MSKVAVIDARKDLADILNRAAYGKERVVLTRRGKDVAAIVPMDDLAILEAIEDHMDVTESEKILERVRRGSEETRKPSRSRVQLNVRVTLGCPLADAEPIILPRLVNASNSQRHHLSKVFQGPPCS